MISLAEPEVYAQRRTTLLSTLPNQSAVLLSNPSDISYYCGFAEFLLPKEREALLFLDNHQTILFFPPLTSVPPLPSTIKQVASVNTTNVVDTLVQHLATHSADHLFVDMQSLVAAEYQHLMSANVPTPTALDRQFIWRQRMIKELHELTAIKQAMYIAQQAFDRCQSSLRAGITELQLARLLDRAMQDLGADSVAFPTIIAFAEHSALAHHQPTDRPLANNQAILVDFGAKYQGYCSDMTRSFWFGTNQPDQYTQLKQAVDNAYHRVLEGLEGKALATASAIDQAVRLVFAQAKLEHLFNHTTGHGLGLDIHEPPSLNSRNQDSLQPNMVITIEPGLYIKNQFGYRHENTVVITESSAEVLADIS